MTSIGAEKNSPSYLDDNIFRDLLCLEEINILITSTLEVSFSQTCVKEKMFHIGIAQILPKNPVALKYSSSRGVKKSKVQRCYKLFISRSM